MKHRIGICDDEIAICSELECYLLDFFREQTDDVEVFVWNSAETFINDVPEKVNVDILFLDIELPQKNGVDVGYYIRETIHDEGMHIIFISYKSSYAMELFDLHPYNFLIKPMKREKVYSEIQKLLQLDSQDKRFFSYSYNKNRYKILMGDIIYFKSEKHHIKVIYVDGKKEYVGKLKDEIKKLPSNFAMISQSVIVNVRHIRECLVTDLIMDNGDQLSISRSYRVTFNMKMIENSKWGEIKDELA
ncbi:MAG: LytR/AlgR family response regulator transcription factor [Lachnospira sp.]